MSSGGSLAVWSGAPSLVRSRWADYVELTRPRPGSWSAIAWRCSR
jgi:hypothetical protein